MSFVSVCEEMRANISCGASSEPLMGPPARRHRTVQPDDFSDGLCLKVAAKVVVDRSRLSTSVQQPFSAGVSRQC